MMMMIKMKAEKGWTKNNLFHKISISSSLDHDSDNEGATSDLEWGFLRKFQLH